MSLYQVRDREWLAQHEPARVCMTCLEHKPHDAFSIAYKRDGTPRLHSYCKKCRNQRAKDCSALGRHKDRKKRKPNRIEIWPRPFGEAMRDVQAKRWRYPVEAGQLRIAL